MFLLLFLSMIDAVTFKESTIFIYFRLASLVLVGPGKGQIKSNTFHLSPLHKKKETYCLVPVLQNLSKIQLENTSHKTLLNESQRVEEVFWRSHVKKFCVGTFYPDDSAPASHPGNLTGYWASSTWHKKCLRWEEDFWHYFRPRKENYILCCWISAPYCLQEASSFVFLGFICHNIVLYGVWNMMNQRPPMTGQRYDECLGVLKFILGADQW